MRYPDRAAAAAEQFELRLQLIVIAVSRPVTMAIIYVALALLIKIVGATIGRPRVGQFPEVNENMIFGNSAYFAALHDLRNGRPMAAPTISARVQ